MIWLLAIAALILGLLLTPLLREKLRKPITEALRRDAPGDFAELSAGLTHYRWIGPARGPVAVCIHGVSTPSEGFLPLAQELTEMGYRVLLYDIYGRGYSDYVPGPQDRAFFHQQLQELLAHEGIVEDFTLIGYSAGGSIASSFAAEHLPRVRQLTLIATMGMHHPKSQMARFLEQRNGAFDVILRLHYHIAVRRYMRAALADPKIPEDIARAQRAQLQRRGFFPSYLAAIRGILRTLNDEDQRLFNQQGLPVLAIWAGADQFIPRQVIGHLAEVNRSAKQDVIEGADHGVLFTHPTEIARIIAENLRLGLY
ncbi:alpha/beta fold hydrolase [Phaeobacter sp. HF9A]|uniref:alpha/beta fold hydrolase n=1 Tax=Phaeobacter sp. HF9A TaxID=2721561 RepID=UPI001432132A|nr:alpha/beta fold hydrolase [Phaeobacter sp. HF9A]NIZ14780.1 alpha/beta hydrolase [Phaeobacter sp. HF9A]